nr:glycoside hydrolase family 3 N-terminal domain-containing protein [Cellulosimicrobium sp. MM]
MTARARTTWIVVAVVTALAAVAAVAWYLTRPASAPQAPPSGTPSAPADPTPSGTSPTPSTPPEDPLAGWTLEQKVGQLFMVGVDVRDPQQVSYDASRGCTWATCSSRAARRRTGPTADLVAGFTALVSPETTNGTPLFVATDQEGGKVQVLRGPGFSQIPTATDQARLDPATLQADATTWGAELAAAGVNLNLAPVMDLLPEGTAAQNPPIGLPAHYGTPTVLHANAFSAAWRRRRGRAIKHFPGLGRVTENTDTDAGVTDDVTTRDDASVAVFASGIEAGAAFVMTSTAVYPQIDGTLPRPSRPSSWTGCSGDWVRRRRPHRRRVRAQQVQAWSPRTAPS